MQMIYRIKERLIYYLHALKLNRNKTTQFSCFAKLINVISIYRLNFLTTSKSYDYIDTQYNMALSYRELYDVLVITDS